MMMKENAAFFTGNDRFEGYVADILRRVAASLRFDYEICLSTDGTYGEQNADGRWNGIIGEVVRGVTNHSVTSIISSEVTKYNLMYAVQLWLRIRNRVRPTKMFQSPEVTKAKDNSNTYNNCPVNNSGKERCTSRTTMQYK